MLEGIILVIVLTVAVICILSWFITCVLGKRSNLKCSFNLFILVSLIGMIPEHIGEFLLGLLFLCNIFAVDLSEMLARSPSKFVRGAADLQRRYDYLVRKNDETGVARVTELANKQKIPLLKQQRVEATTSQADRAR
ncbi:MAG: hypothetical protein CBC65_001715 [Rhodothermaceae bacterium TMED105]|jgi:low affinity Fe/Cu permease|nr:MAG: hypothetical protein CBC65_001715 [Rhodothermaceae bacterium TMED105]|tara:strand:- start:7920 stop:8330 length:411 start_codon:yes stop_codon:yes gene_type:complete